jgi:putative transposase
LLAHAPERLHAQIFADYNAIIYVAAREEVERQRARSSFAKWRLKRRPVADSLQEAGERLFTPA